VETVECWQLALARQDGPSVLALTRQGVPQLRLAHDEHNRCAAGAYEIVPAEGYAAVSLFATGSEVSIAIEARKHLRQQGVPARVVSGRCFGLFFDAREGPGGGGVGEAPARVGGGAGVRRGWDKIIGSDGAFVGMPGYGASAPAKDLYRHFG